MIELRTSRHKFFSKTIFSKMQENSEKIQMYSEKSANSFKTR